MYKYSSVGLGFFTRKDNLLNTTSLHDKINPEMAFLLYHILDVKFNITEIRINLASFCFYIVHF